MGRDGGRKMRVSNEHIQSPRLSKNQKCPKCGSDAEFLGVGYPSGDGFLKCLKCKHVFKEDPDVQ